MTTALRPERDMQVENLGEYEARVLFPEPKPSPLTTKYATVFSAKKPLQLELGGTLAPVRVAYTTYGTLNKARDNAVVVCHALTGSSQVGGADGWWPELIGPGRMLDTDRDFVICSNVLGGCYGTTGPASPEPETGRDYGPNFPEITIADMVQVQRALADHLKISSIRAVVGGSMGGMLALEWLKQNPEFVRSGVVIGAPPRHSAWGIIFSHLARMAIQNDPDFRGGRYAAQPGGLALARAITTLFFRCPESFNRTQGRNMSPTDITRFAMETYLEHQGEKLLERFDANAYITISKAMDRFALTDGELVGISQPVFCVGISSDILYLPSEVQELAQKIPDSLYWELDSPHGHDAFLLETDVLEIAVTAFLEKQA
jgi:homoserine O-acetyltransferase/O-succinyltransferase